VLASAIVTLLSACKLTFVVMTAVSTPSVWFVQMGVFSSHVDDPGPLPVCPQSSLLSVQVTAKLCQHSRSLVICFYWYEETCWLHWM